MSDNTENQAGGFFSEIRDFINGINELSSRGGKFRTLEYLLAAVGGLEILKSKRTVWGWFINILSLIIVGVDKMLDPAHDFTTGLFVRYSRAVRVMLPIAVFGFIVSVVVALGGFYEQSTIMLSLYSLLLVLPIAFLVDFVLIHPVTPGRSGWKWQGRCIYYGSIVVGTVLFIGMLNGLFGSNNPGTLLMSTPFLMIVSMLYGVIVLPVLWIAYKLATWQAKQAAPATTDSETGENATAKEETPSFSGFILNPLFRMFFFVWGALVTFNMVRVFNIGPEWFYGSVVALLVLGIAANNTPGIKKFLEKSTVTNMFIKLGFAVLACLLMIVLPKPGDRGMLQSAVQNWFGNQVSDVVQSSYTRPAGDIVFDHVVDSTDLAMLDSIITHKMTVTATDSAYADVNQDGKLNGLDKALMTRALANNQLMILQRPEFSRKSAAVVAQADSTRQKKSTASVNTTATPPQHANALPQLPSTKPKQSMIASGPANQAMFGTLMVSKSMSPSRNCNINITVDSVVSNGGTTEIHVTYSTKGRNMAKVAVTGNSLVEFTMKDRRGRTQFDTRKVRECFMESPVHIGMFEKRQLDVDQRTINPGKRIQAYFVLDKPLPANTNNAQLVLRHSASREFKTVFI